MVSNNKNSFRGPLHTNFDLEILLNMATVKQKRALDKIVENGGNVSRAMMEVGYSPRTAKTPQKLTESKGFQELMEESGLTDQLLIDSLVDDIKGKPKRRFKELELGFKVRSRLSPEGNEAPTKSVTNNITQIIINAPHASETGNKPYRETVPSVAGTSES